MEARTGTKVSLIDGSRLIVESLVRSGADIYIGYPITPTNWIYAYSQKRFPMMLAAPDEITTLQWMAGWSAAGYTPVTATSFPGFALMVESINMAFMMELPMVIVLAQRLGPSTGTATAGAQGDLLLINGLISGGYPVPTFSPSNMIDCWKLPNIALRTAVELRTPVIVLTSKEMVMTKFTVDLSELPELEPIRRKFYEGDKPYRPYLPRENMVPEFLPVGNDRWQVRLTASTHNEDGIIQHTSTEAMDNTRRLQAKMFRNLDSYLSFELDEVPGADTLLISYGITALAAREATRRMREMGYRISLLIVKTLIPVAPLFYQIFQHYSRIVVAEENLNGEYKEILFGKNPGPNVVGVNAIGKMISPDDIIEGVLRND